MLKNQKNPVEALDHFISFAQNCAIWTGLQGEEGVYFANLLDEQTQVIENMPKSYETDGQGESAVAYLHYFVGGCDWYITEKDMEPGEQLQAFGLANLGYGGELGYISIKEITAAGAELDLHWTPQALRLCKLK